MPAQISVVENIQEQDLGDLADKDWDTLFREGKLGILKKSSQTYTRKMRDKKFPNLKEN